MYLRPSCGGFQRPFGCAWFTMEFLRGQAPQGSKTINPDEGAPMNDIHFEYKNALHRAYAREALDKEMESRIGEGKAIYSEVLYGERLGYYLARIPYKLSNMKYASFTRYFGHLKRLGWVEKTGVTEPSTIQDNYSKAPPRVFYRLTAKGCTATPEQIADPVKALYHYSRDQRSSKSHAYFKP